MTAQKVRKFKEKWEDKIRTYLVRRKISNCAVNAYVKLSPTKPESMVSRDNTEKIAVNKIIRLAQDSSLKINNDRICCSYWLYILLNVFSVQLYGIFILPTKQPGRRNNFWIIVHLIVLDFLVIICNEIFLSFERSNGWSSTKKKMQRLKIIWCCSMFFNTKITVII